MAKDKISDYSSTANSNTDIAGINIDEGCAPSGINDAIRTLMAQLKTWQSGGQDVYIHPAGSASAPSITANGDTNTGIFFPAADTVGISTGGTERARVDSAGNMGIGTTSPLRTLDIVQKTNDTTPVLLLRGYTTGTDGSRTTQITSVSSDANNWANVQMNAQAFIWSYQGSSERMRLDASGNLGIALTSPTTKLDVAGAVSATPVTNGVVRIVTTGSNPATGSGGGLLFAQQNSGGTYSNYASITGSRVNNAANNKVDLVFSTGSPGDSIAIAERMRIDTGGNLGLGTSSPVANTRATIYADSGTAMFVQIYQVAPTLVQFANSQGNGGAITMASGGATSYGTSSDYRLKENIQPLTGALSRVAQLKPVVFNWKVDGSDGESFIAHELAEVCPQAVHGEKDAVDEDGNPKYQNIDTSHLVSLLTAAIQELKAEFDAYKASHP